MNHNSFNGVTNPLQKYENMQKNEIYYNSQ
jgi:hypothetical protein